VSAPPDGRREKTDGTVTVMDANGESTRTTATARIAGAALAALAAGAVAAALARAPLDLGVMYPWKVVLALAGGAVAVWWWLARDPQAHPPAALTGPANGVTLARAVLVVLMLAAVGERGTIALSAVVTVLAVAVAALDGVDGWVARRSGTASDLGARFDMETDALLILALALLAWTWDKAGAWVLIGGAARYVFVAAAGVAPWMRRPLPPSLRRKTACVVQVITLIACVCPWVPWPASAWLAAGGLAALLYSFVTDTLWLAREARAHDPEGAHP